MSFILTLDENTGFNTKVTDSITGETVGNMTNVHPTSVCASADGCAIHNRPSNHLLKDSPMVWREDRGILERQCEHGVGHPDFDSAKYLKSIGKDYENIHGCDGCC